MRPFNQQCTSINYFELSQRPSTEIMRISGMILFIFIGCLCYVAANDVECTKKRCPGINQEHRPCGTYWYCEPTCREPDGEPCPTICVDGCFCKKNYIREYTNGTCISKEDCGREV